MIKSKFHHFWPPPGKILKKSTSSPLLEKILPTPMCRVITFKAICSVATLTPFRLVVFLRSWQQRNYFKNQNVVWIPSSSEKTFVIHGCEDSRFALSSQEIRLSCSVFITLRCFGLEQIQVPATSLRKATQLSQSANCFNRCQANFLTYYCLYAKLLLRAKE